MRIFAPALLYVVCLLMPAQILAEGFEFVSGSVQFTIKNAGIKVNGSFSGLSAKVLFIPEKPTTASIEGKVETNTIETGINLRNKHLKKEAYFDVAKFPQMEMKLLRLEGSGNQFNGHFSLSIKGTTKNISIPIEFKQNGNAGTLSTRFTINRLDFGIGESSWTMADEVAINIQFQIKKS